MQLQRQAVLPLRIRHLEQVDLRHGAGDVKQGVDAPEPGQGPIDDGLCSRRLGEIRVEDQRIGTGCFRRVRGLLQTGAIARHQDHGREIARQANRGRPADALAGACDNGN
jgi:hypothetical protein